MQHLKVKPKFAYAFMAAIRMVPLIISSLIQLRRSKNALSNDRCI